MQFTWKAVPGAQCYKVYYKGQTAKTWKTLKKDVTETSFHHVSSKTFPLTTGKKYVYTVRAVYGSMLSSCNKTGKVVTPKVAAATLGTVTSAAYNKLKITWSAVEGATGYAIYRRSGSAWQKIAVTSATSYIHTSSSQFPVYPGETYTYTVRSYRKMGKSTYSWGNYNKTGIQGKAVPNKPALVSAVYQDPGKITITWKKAAGATHYMIFWKNSKGQWAQIAKVSADNLSYTHVSSDKFPIEKGKTYIYTVRSYTTTGNTRGLYDKKGKTVEAVNPTEEVDKKLKEVTTKILSQITNSSMTKAQKLRACWNFVTSGANFSYWPKYPNTSQVGWQRTTALDMLTTRRGNCYSFACGFAALAKEIGYSPSVVCGRVSGSRDGSSDGMTRHSWVVIGGTYYDPEAHYAGWYKNVYGSGSYDVNHTIQSVVSF